MATLVELEEALAAADAAGDTEAAQHLADVIRRAAMDKANLIPGTQIPETLPQVAEPTVGEEAIGAGEAGLTLATGASTGALGFAGGLLKGLAEQLLSGKFGTPEAARAVEEAALKGGALMTYAPRTQAGREDVQAMGEVLANVPPVLPQAIPAAAATKLPAIQRPGAPAPAAPKGSLGAAATPEALRRITVAEQMPVPFKGEAGLTAGQASRDFAQLQFEKETAKIGEAGAPLRERVQNQTAVMLQNFDAMVDKAGPLAVEPRDIGKAVNQAIVNKANIAKRKIQEAYKRAEEAGETAEAVEMDPLATALADLERFEGIVPMITSVRKEAMRIGAVARDERAPGSPILPGRIPLYGTEQLRQFVNEATDWGNKREAVMAKRINSAIDTATEGKGGALYKQARKLRAEFAGEFENVGLTSKLLGEKRGTTERQIAFEDVFDKIILLSPVEEMNKLRSTLLTAGPEGKQAWADLKAAGIEHIKESSLSAAGRDAAGQPILSPDKLSKTVRRLDKAGKLETLYGKRQAQVLRDLAELSADIYTAPPGAVNFSGTASALRVVLDTVATGLLTGIPAPATTALREALRFAKNRKLKVRIEEALNPMIR